MNYILNELFLEDKIWKKYIIILSLLTKIVVYIKEIKVREIIIYILIRINVFQSLLLASHQAHFQSLRFNLYHNTFSCQIQGFLSIIT